MAIEVTPNTPRADFTVSGVLLTCPQPISEGFILETEGEVQAMNQTYKENVRNNNAKAVAEILEKAGIKDTEDGVPEDIVKACQKVIDDACKTYQFGVRAGGVRTPQDKALAMALDIVRKKIVDNARDTQGKKASDWDKAELRTECEKVLDKNPKLLEFCKRKVAEEQAQDIEL